MKQFITVLKVEPRKHPVVDTIATDLRSLQNAVDGMIDIIGIPDDSNACILLNDEGKLIGMEGNRYFCNDIIAGVFYICGINENGDLCSLTREQVRKFKILFYNPDVISQKEVEESCVIKIIPFDDL